ncbi:hypothetical protein BH20ACT9_BH20ACT9_10490 [soil metagenome]
MSDGATLATIESGTLRTHPPVVLLHGGPGLWDYLAPLAEMLCELTVSYRYDQRGCGNSSSSDELSMARYVDDLHELIESWGHDHVVIIGHSFGATLALAYGALHPDRVAAIGYLSGVGIGDWRTPYRAERAWRAAPFADRLAELSARATRSRQEETEWRQLSWATDYADPVAGIELARPMAESPLSINLRANRETSFTDADQIGWAAATACPVTFIHGTADPRPVANSMMLAAHAPRARTRVVQGAGHLPWAERPADIQGLLREIVLTASE